MYQNPGRRWNYGRSSSYGNAWNRALDTLHREAREERSFLSDLATAGRRSYKDAANAEINFYKDATKWACLW